MAYFNFPGSSFKTLKLCQLIQNLDCVQQVSSGICHMFLYHLQQDCTVTGHPKYNAQFYNKWTFLALYSNPRHHVPTDTARINRLTPLPELTWLAWLKAVTFSPVSCQCLLLLFWSHWIFVAQVLRYLLSRRCVDLLPTASLVIRPFTSTPSGCRTCHAPVAVARSVVTQRTTHRTTRLVPAILVQFFACCDYRRWSTCKTTVVNPDASGVCLK